MADSDEVKKLLKLQEGIDRVHGIAVGLREYSLAQQALEISHKIQQKIDGHRAQKKRKK